MNQERKCGACVAFGSYLECWCIFLGKTEIRSYYKGQLTESAGRKTFITILKKKKSADVPSPKTVSDEKELTKFFLHI